MKNSQTVLGFVGLMSVFAAGSAFADCKQVQLRSADGTTIEINYQPQSQTDGDSAWVKPSVHVFLSSTKCTAETVIVQMVNSQFGNAAATPLTLTRKGPSSCEFVGVLRNATLANHGGTIGHQIAIQVLYGRSNEEWLVGPVNGGHNFNFAYQVDGSSVGTLDACE